MIVFGLGTRRRGVRQVTRRRWLLSHPRQILQRQLGTPFQARAQHAEAEASHSNLPRIAQPSMWKSVIPRALRPGGEQTPGMAAKKTTNPATYFIWIYLLIGSQAIRIIGLQNEFNTYMRRAELKIEKLREVISKLQRGEPVDVENVLGTGDETQEQEWEEALREIEQEEQLWQNNKQKRREEKARKDDASPVNEAENDSETGSDSLPSKMPFQQTPGFY